MKNHKYFIVRLRQSFTLRFATIVVLGIAAIVSVPQVDIGYIHASPQTQRILSPDSIPIASPSYINKPTPESAEFIPVVINEADLNEHFQTYAILEHCSAGYAHTLTSCLIYSQTTSSCL